MLRATPSSLRLLLLGGTTEASALARALTGDPAIDVVLSLAGRTSAPLLPPVAVRIGGFGGADGLAAFLAAGRFDAVVDATHPFATAITANALHAARTVGIPLLALRRPAWQAEPGDRWIEAADMAAAVARLGDVPRRVLLTIGQRDLALFARARHRYVVRSVEPPDPATLPGARVITARGPFTLDGETELLRTHRIEVVVTKNSGGTATAAKLAAARALAIPVVMVARPPGETPAVADVAAALRWIHDEAARKRGV